MFEAISQGDTESLKKFIAEGLNINQYFDFFEDTPLCLAAAIGQFDIVKLLVENGADVNARYEDGKFPLLSAARKEHLNIMQYLIDNGADVNAKLDNGYTILFNAVMGNKINVVKLLLKNGADPNIKNKFNDNGPLDHAIGNYQTNIVVSLMEYGAKPKKDYEEKLYKILESVKLRKLVFEPVVKSLKTPFGNILMIKDAADMPATIPDNITSIEINPINLKKLPELSNKIQYLNCSGNPIKCLPEKLPSNLKVLICENCKLEELPPLPKTLEYLDARNNFLHDIVSLPPKLFIAPMKQLNDSANYEASSALLLSGNPLPHGLLNGFGSITKFNRDHIHKTYEFNHEVVYTMILPKGTILFRDKDMPYSSEEIMGIEIEYCKYKIYPEFNVFFYPYPFVAEFFLGTNYMNVFELKRDVEIVMGVLPSSNSRSNRFDNNYLMSCNKIPTQIENIEGENIVGREYDPCLNPKFTEIHKNINGMIMLAKDDTDIHLSNSNIQRFWTKYRTNHMDYRHAVGVPEIILHPWANRYDSISANNYKHIKQLKHECDTYDAAWEYVDKKLGANGGWSIDLFTKMYVNYEAASDEVKARCVPLEEPYKLHYLNYSVWDPIMFHGGGVGSYRITRKRKRSVRKIKK